MQNCPIQYAKSHYDRLVSLFESEIEKAPA